MVKKVRGKQSAGHLDRANRRQLPAPPKEQVEEAVQGDGDDQDSPRPKPGLY